MRPASNDLRRHLEEHELVDQHGTVLQHGKFTFLVAKRAVLS